MATKKKSTGFGKLTFKGKVQRIMRKQGVSKASAERIVGSIVKGERKRKK